MVVTTGGLNEAVLEEASPSCVASVTCPKESLANQLKNCFY